ncbi:hypothetical protein E3U55_04555 [Filobacillus milosensis]|uniref:Uncharacterized protein n=1 Tax=Filobacillus milosensis TaxID=94137 RepID=A0A4Y8IV75_9BACI|nr:hypothetical protein [Filobacillus milosensis]TFB24089.1 hypothetical protein E3U55_04555 [Filobacillus milosensis]
MKKVLLSFVGGLLIGGIISYLFLDNNDSNYEIRNYYGIDSKQVKEWDFEFIFNSGIIIAGISFIIYLVWTFIEKKTKHL